MDGQHYFVEHLATFSTSLHGNGGATNPKQALQRLFAMEKSSGIWTQRMALRVEGSHMLIIDGESDDIVERFPVNMIRSPTAFHQANDIYNNILILTVQHPDEPQGELHIFQCVSQSAIGIAEELNGWMRRHGNDHVAPNRGDGSRAMNVKQAVTAFNAIAAQREKDGAVSPSAAQGRDQLDSRSVTSSSVDSSGHHNGTPRGMSHDHNLSNERFVSILNHCFDDIERFIIRLQHAAAALRELQFRNHKRQGKQRGGGRKAARRIWSLEDVT